MWIYMYAITSANVCGKKNYNIPKDGQPVLHTPLSTLHHDNIGFGEQLVNGRDLQLA